METTAVGTDLRLLIVEDSKIDTALLINELNGAGFKLVSKRVETPEDFSKALAEESWDVICSDYTMPRFSALAALEMLKKTGLDIPFIVVSGSIGEDLAVQAMHLGASDYLMKDNLARLPIAVARETDRMTKQRILKKVEDLLKETENSYRQLVEVVTDYGIFMIDPKGNVLSWNKGAERILEWNAEEILGKPTSTLFSAQAVKDGVPGLQLSTARDEGRYEDESEMLRKGGNAFISHCVVVPVYNAKGSLTGFSKIMRDISERKAAEAKIQKLADELEQRVIERTADLARVNRELESFTHSVSHDLRAPLRQMVQLSEALLERQTRDLDKNTAEYLGFIMEASLKALALVNALLELSNVTSATLAKQPVDVTRLVTEISEKQKIANPKRNVVFVLADNMSANGDPDLIRIAFQNLLDNAWKFTSKKESARIEVACKKENGKTIFSIQDNGAGFDPVHKEKLFMAFRRLHRDDEFPGTGIGLATVQRIVHRHGGEIWAESTVNKGADFYFTLSPASDN